MPTRNVYKPSKQSPYDLYNISTGAGFVKDRENKVLPDDAQMPAYSARKKAAENGWYIEVRTRTRGKELGKSYYVPLKDISEVAWMDKMSGTQTTFQPPVNAQPKEPKPQVRFIEKRLQRDFSIKRRHVKELLEKAHTQNIPNDIDDDEKIVELIANAKNLKPAFLKMEENSWKLLVRSALRGKNVLMLGDKGEGKTMAAYALKNALGRPFFTFNFGNTQDAQTALIGKTHLDMQKGTWFNESEFVKAIQTPNAVILCDEISRMSEDASNILFSVFDENQRYLRINESTGVNSIAVAKGVCFVATANIGFQYTGTRKLDAAMFDRWVKIEVDHLSKADRMSILKNLFPDLTDYIVETIADIADKIRENYESDDPKFTTTFSTRMCITLAELLYDGFEFLAAVEKTVYPEYSAEGNMQSERTYVKQIVQGLYRDSEAKYPFKSQRLVKVKVDEQGNEIA